MKGFNAWLCNSILEIYIYKFKIQDHRRLCPRLQYPLCMHPLNHCSRAICSQMWPLSVTLTSRQRWKDLRIKILFFKFFKILYLIFFYFDTNIRSIKKNVIQWEVSFLQCAIPASSLELTGNQCHHFLYSFKVFFYVYTSQYKFYFLHFFFKNTKGTIPSTLFCTLLLSPNCIF